MISRSVHIWLFAVVSGGRRTSPRTYICENIELRSAQPGARLDSNMHFYYCLWTGSINLVRWLSYLYPMRYNWTCRYYNLFKDDYGYVAKLNFKQKKIYFNTFLQLFLIYLQLDVYFSSHIDSSDCCNTGSTSKQSSFTVPILLRYLK